MRLRFALVPVAALLFLGQATLAQEPREAPLAKTSGERLLDDAVKRLRARWYDRRAKIDWDGLADPYRERLRGAESPRAAHTLVNEMLGTLKTSHLALIEGTVYERELGAEFEAKKTVRAGLELVLLDGQLFVGSTYEDGPAARAGLVVGDEVLEIDGVPATSSPRLEDAAHDPGLPGPHGYVLSVKKDDRVKLTIRRDRGEPVRQLVLEPFATSLVEAARASAQLVDLRGKKLARLHLPHFQSPRIADLFEEAIAGPFKTADALVLDVRGRGGRADLVGRILSAFGGERATWRRPVVVLLDRGTRSAKEVFAWSFRRQGLGTLVGERTAGAVIGCGFEKLFDGSVLMLPILDVRRMTNGETLEGKGVEPDVLVDPGPLPYRRGRDRIGERGEEVALARIAARARAWH